MSPSIGSENTGVPRDKAGGTSRGAPTPPRNLAARRRPHPAISTFPNDFLFPFEAIFFLHVIMENFKHRRSRRDSPMNILLPTRLRRCWKRVQTAPLETVQRVLLGGGGCFQSAWPRRGLSHVTSQREMQMKPPSTAPRCQHAGPQHTTHKGGGTWREGNPRALWKVVWKALKNSSIELPENQQSLLWVFI